MAEYNRVKIADLYLTSDGTETGIPCRVDVVGLTKLRPVYRRTVVLPIEGKPHVQLFENLIGESFSMTIFQLHTDEYDDLIEIIDAADAGDGEINVTLDGETGDFDLQCVLESIDQPGEFSSNYIPSLQLVFRIASVNPIEEEEEE